MAVNVGTRVAIGAAIFGAVAVVAIAAPLFLVPIKASYPDPNSIHVEDIMYPPPGNALSNDAPQHGEPGYTVTIVRPPAPPPANAAQ
jgi:hypothetical protein